MRDRPQIPDYYSVLGIGFDASQDELRRAWRAAQKQWHPDRNPAPEADQKIREINAAWEVLGDPERRAEYDSIYFAVRARIAEEERRAHEAERLEREHRERLRQQELERKMRAEAEARRRAEEEEQRRKAEERKRKQQEREERERRERALAEKRAEAVAEARRRAEEEDRRDRERRRREEKLAEEARKREERDGSEDAMRGGGYRPPGPPVGATARDKRGWVWGLAAAVTIAILAAIAVIIAAGNRTTEEAPTVVVLVTATRVPPPTPIPPTATAVPTPTRVPPTATAVPTSTVTPTPAPRLVIIYVTATPTPTVRALPTARPRPTPRPTATPRPTPVPTRRPVATSTPRPTRVPNPSPTPKPRYQGSPLDLHDLLDRDQVTLDHVRALLESGAPVSAANIMGESPLTVAARRGHHANILSLLIAHGADPSRYPFVLHALLGNTDVSSSQVLTLLQHGAQIDSEDVNGVSPLEVAVANGQSVRVLRVLLFNGAKLYTSPTILHDLLSTGAATAEKVKLLIDAGASATATNISGKTPLDVALENGLDATILGLLGYENSEVDASIRLATPTATLAPDVVRGATSVPPCLPGSDVPCYPDLVMSATPTPAPQRALTLRSMSGMMASRHGEGYIGCPPLLTDSEYIASAARMGVVEFDFVVPRVARWSVGVVYHVGSGANTDSATMTFRDGAGPLKVGHWTRTNGLNVSLHDSMSVGPDIVQALPGDIVKFEFATDDDGTTLTLDGVQVLAVPSGDLKPLAGPMQMCVGFWSSELLDYGIEYKRLRAWAE